MVETFWAYNSRIYMYHRVWKMMLGNDERYIFKCMYYPDWAPYVVLFSYDLWPNYNVSTEKSTSNACFPRIQRRKIRWNEVDFTIKTTWYVDLWRTKVSFWMKKSTSLSSIGRLFQSKWYRMMWQSLTKKRLITDERRKIYWDWLGHMIATYHCYNC